MMAPLRTTAASRPAGLGHGHAFEFLRIIGGQAGEHDYADIADNHLHGRTFEKYIDDRGNQYTDQAHKHKVSHSGQITLGHPTKDTTHGKRAGTDEKRRSDRRHGVSKENKR